MLILLAGLILLDVMSVFVKFLLPKYSATELSAYRNVVGMVPSVFLLLYTGQLKVPWRELVIRQYPLALARGIAVALAQLFFYMGLVSLDFAVVSALVYTVALFTVALSVPILGERVGLFRWAAVLLGFAGALWIVQPGSGIFTYGALFPLAAAALYAFSGVTVRLIDSTVSNALLYLYSAFAAAVGAVLLALVTGGFSVIASFQDAIQIVLMGLFGGTGVLFLMVAFRMVQPSVLAPFNYFGLLSAFLWGWLVFGEAPIDRLFPGALFIIAAGLLILWRENKVNNESDKMP